MQFEIYFVMKKIIIAAIASNGIIGRADGSMPWHVKEEFKHFKSTTIGYPMIMGRVTFESLGKPLPERTNIVITSNKNYFFEDESVKIFNNLEEAYSFCEAKNFEKCFITGGAKIYKLALNTADEMILSRMKFEAEGSIAFPFFDEKEWTITQTENHEQFEVFYYTRRNV